MARKPNKDSTETQDTTAQVIIDNNGVRKTVTKAIDLVVINNAVVPDPSQVNPGVVINAQQTK